MHSGAEHVLAEVLKYFILTSGITVSVCDVWSPDSPSFAPYLRSVSPVVVTPSYLQVSCATKTNGKASVTLNSIINYQNGALARNAPRYYYYHHHH